jgi:hypothetical protein
MGKTGDGLRVVKKGKARVGIRGSVKGGERERVKGGKEERSKGGEKGEGLRGKGALRVGKGGKMGNG